MANRPDTLAYGAFAVAEDGTLYAGNNTNAAVEQAKQATLAQEITDRAADTATCLRSSAQTLTVEQQTQARTNIGAASAASAASATDLTTETNERITADTGVRGLTATVETTSTASKAYAIGAYFVYNGLLYKCTVAIAKGGTITPGTNCTATTAGAEISTLNQNLTTKSAAVSAINYASGNINMGKSGHIVECQITGVIVNQTLPAGTYYPIGTIPAGFRAAYVIYKTLLPDTLKRFTLKIDTAGTISLLPFSEAGVSGDAFYDCFSWIV